MEGFRDRLLKVNRSWIHPELEPYIEGLAALVDSLNAINFKIPDLNTLPDNQLIALDWLLGQPTYANNTAVSIPILNPTICDLMVGYLQDKDFNPNLNETPEYQIPEYILAQHDPDLFNAFVQFAESSLFLVYNLFWGKYPDTVESIQLAKYAPTGVTKTEWHHDAESNMTGLINLAPELYTGGGTDIRTSLLSFDHIPSVPKGHALIFNGNMLLHRGAEIKDGVRYLLVYWVTTDRKVKNETN